MIGRRRAKKDPVTPELHDAVIARDLRLAGGCVARFLEPDGHYCYDQWGNPHRPDFPRHLTLDHVQDGGGRMGKRAPSDLAHLVSLCYFAHLGGWATSHRPLLREYIERANRDDSCAHVDPDTQGCPSCRRRTDMAQMPETA